MHLFFLYIDPGTGGMIIQMLIGVAVTIGVFFRNIKYFILHLFKEKTNHHPLKRRIDHEASYKDPSARVFFLEDEPDHIFRELAPSYHPHYQKFVDSGLADTLRQKKWIVEFEEMHRATANIKEPQDQFCFLPIRMDL